MNKKLRFGIIGCGVISKTHVYAIQQAGGELVACADVVPEKAEVLAGAWGADVYSNYREMLQRSDIDVVNICTPSGMHADMTVEASRQRKHVIVEKPMDITLAQADRMITACRENGVKLAVISQHRFDPSTVYLKRAVTEGRLGRLALGDASVKWFRTQAYYDSGEWRGTWALDGGGALMNQAIHTVDLLQYIMGDVASISANTATLGHERIEVEDVATATVKFRSGALGTIVATTCAYPGLSARLEVHGDKGSAVIDADKLVYFHTVAEQAEKERPGSPESAEGGDAPTAVNPGGLDPWAHGQQVKDMVEAIREDRESLVNGEEGRKPLRIVLALYQAMKTGQTVEL
ncbi:Oxidoreductase family, NAD-binding Rossmann fold [Acididesulfobacillus acetoxydans]|uniref:Oxidoreductase domain protein n=1 Tax=Acididesulfobacillus acetoxydans TaxID=1561005 RepID=A0A8S0WHE0_9FIRM|nr:Gfo/Idh/MocA family oxidoreductase [Acididesulfobacillus acetoxydans]CAA7602622.1 Oxidoreductase family, NAD-binding Rossmann fold [Acididesulfobacillus acetoxydans]CEJ09181.1 Oxidoreductase domain protein [Acididesulfobacillus acetoxydans]